MRVTSPWKIFKRKHTAASCQRAPKQKPIRCYYATWTVLLSVIWENSRTGICRLIQVFLLSITELWKDNTCCWKCQYSSKLLWVLTVLGKYHYMLWITIFARTLMRLEWVTVVSIKDITLFSFTIHLSICQRFGEFSCKLTKLQVWRYYNSHYFCFVSLHFSNWEL